MKINDTLLSRLGGMLDVLLATGHNFAAKLRPFSIDHNFADQIMISQNFLKILCRIVTINLVPYKNHGEILTEHRTIIEKFVFFFCLICMYTECSA